MEEPSGQKAADSDSQSTCLELKVSRVAGLYLMQ
jgi:hypothetical protein